MKAVFDLSRMIVKPRCQYVQRRGGQFPRSHFSFPLTFLYLLAAGAVSSSVPRPSELLATRLQPLLAERGLPADSARRDWPTDVLVTVLEQLQQDTAPDILAR